MPTYVAFFSRNQPVCIRKLTFSQTRSPYPVKELPPIPVSSAAGETPERRFKDLVLPHLWAVVPGSEMDQWQLALDQDLPGGLAVWRSTYAAQHLTAYRVAQARRDFAKHVLITAEIADLEKPAKELIRSSATTVPNHFLNKLDGLHAHINSGTAPNVRDWVVVTGQLDEGDPQRILKRARRNGRTLTIDVPVNGRGPKSTWTIQLCENVKAMYDRLQEDGITLQ